METDDRSAGVDPAKARLLESGDGKPSARIVAEVNRLAGCNLTLVGIADEGVSGGALYVRWPDGSDGVLTRSPASMERMRQTADVLAEVRAAGLPVPRHDLIVELEDGVLAIVQERLLGDLPRRVDADVIDAMVAANDWFAGVLANRPDVPIPPMRLRRGAHGRGHQLLENYNARSRRLLRVIHEVGDGEPHEMSGDDLVHPDFTLGNVLYDASGLVTGIVDWNWGVLRGDRHFALVRIYIDLFWSTVYPGRVDQTAFDRLDEVVAERIEPRLLRMYWANITLDQLAVWIANDRQEAIELFLRFGEHRLLGWETADLD